MGHNYEILSLKYNLFVNFYFIGIHIYNIYILYTKTLKHPFVVYMYNLIIFYNTYIYI